MPAIYPLESNMVYTHTVLIDGRFPGAPPGGHTFGGVGLWVYARECFNMCDSSCACFVVQTQKAMPFIVGCPACQHNFVQFWCVLVCSPDQATFTDVTSVQSAFDNNATVVKEVAVWTSDKFMASLYDSCKASACHTFPHFKCERVQRMEHEEVDIASHVTWLTVTDAKSPVSC